MSQLVTETWLRRCTNSRLAANAIGSMRNAIERVIADWMPLLSRAATCRCSAACLQEQLHRQVPAAVRAGTQLALADAAVSRTKMERRLEPIRLSDGCLQVTCCVLDALAKFIVVLANRRRLRQQRSVLESSDLTAASDILQVASQSTVTSWLSGAEPASHTMLESTPVAMDVLADDEDV